MIAATVVVLVADPVNRRIHHLSVNESGEQLRELADAQGVLWISGSLDGPGSVSLPGGATPIGFSRNWGSQKLRDAAARKFCEIEGVEIPEGWLRPDHG